MALQSLLHLLVFSTQNDIMNMCLCQHASGDIQWLLNVLESKFERTTALVKHDSENVRQVKVFNKFIQVQGSGQMHETVARDAELIIKGLGREGTKLHRQTSDQRHESGDLYHESEKRYCSFCARANYLFIG